MQFHTFVSFLLRLSVMSQRNIYLKRKATVMNMVAAFTGIVIANSNSLPLCTIIMLNRGILVTLPGNMLYITIVLYNKGIACYI